MNTNNIISKFEIKLLFQLYFKLQIDINNELFKNEIIYVNLKLMAYLTNYIHSQLN